MDTLSVEKLMRSLRVESCTDGYNSSGPSSLNLELSTAPSSPEPNNTATPLFQQRRRLLSCIAENWPEAEIYSSTNEVFDDSIKEFKINLNDEKLLLPKHFAWEDDDSTDFILALDESRILDIESLEDVRECESHGESMPKRMSVTPLSSRASSHPPIETNDLMCTSYYGKLESDVENVHLKCCSTENITNNSIDGISEKFIFLNPVFSQGKCRTPLPLLKIYDNDSISLTSTNHDQNIHDMHEMENNCTENQQNEVNGNGLTTVDTTTIDENASGKCQLNILYLE